MKGNEKLGLNKMLDLLELASGVVTNENMLHSL
jgi:hypothetical protein